MALPASNSGRPGSSDRPGKTEVDLLLNIVYVNDRICEMLGFSRNHLLGRSILEVIPFHDREKTGQFLRDLLDRGNADDAYPHSNFNRTLHGDMYINWSNRVLFDSKGKVCGLACSALEAETPMVSFPAALFPLASRINALRHKVPGGILGIGRFVKSLIGVVDLIAEGKITIKQATDVLNGFIQEMRSSPRRVPSDDSSNGSSASSSRP